MEAGQRRHPRIVGCIILVLLAGLVGRDLARAGFCAADREKHRIMVELFSHWINARVGHGQQLAGRVLRSGLGVASRLALWRIQAESRVALRQSLDRETPDPRVLRKDLHESWERASRARAVVVPAGTQQFDQDLDRAVRQALSAWCTCRAIRSDRVESCDLLDGFDPQGLDECRAAYVRFGIYYRHRCDQRHLSIASRLTGIDQDLARRWCRILARQTPDALPEEGIPLSPEERAGFRAVAGGGTAPCLQADLPEEARRDCLSHLQHYLFATGQSPPWSWSPDPDEAGLAGALLAARDQQPACREIALWAYDHACQAHFLLQATPLGLLPAWR